MDAKKLTRNYKPQAKKKGIGKRIFITILSLLLILSIATTCYFSYLYYHNPLRKVPEVISEVGEKIGIFEKNDSNYISIYYPSFGKEYIDKLIKDKIGEITISFKEKNSIYDKLNLNDKADIKIGYETYQVTDDVIGVLLKVSEKNAFEEEYSLRLYPFNFDLKNDKEISLEEIFKGRYLNYISQYLEEKLKEVITSDYYDKVRERLYPVKEHFCDFLLQEEGISFYFANDEISKEIDSKLITIPYEVLRGFFKKGYLEEKSMQEESEFLSVNGPLDERIPTIVITFDDGPSQNTAKVLEILRKYNVVATFFLLGNRLETIETSVLNDIFLQGSTINSHSYSHPNLVNLSSEQIQNELESTKQKIAELTGYTIRFVRPPYGSYNQTVKDLCDVPFAMWSVDPRDWDTKDPEVVYQNVVNSVSDGDVILLHDIHDSTVEALPKILEELLSRGYQFATLEEMVDQFSNKLKNGVIIE